MARTRKAILEQYDRIVDIFYKIPLDGSVSILTGKNGSGKSLIRSQLNGRTRKEHDGKCVVHTSMALRTGTHSHMGAIACMVRDSDWNPTSFETVKHIQTAINSLRGNYLCLDEIEIGCAKETIMGIVAWLNKNLRKGIKDSLGCLVITHSEFVVQNLRHDHFFNLDGFETGPEWLEREVKPTDLEVLEKDSLDLFRFIQKNTKKD